MTATRSGKKCGSMGVCEHRPNNTLPKGRGCAGYTTWINILQADAHSAAGAVAAATQIATPAADDPDACGFHTEPDD